MIPVPMVWVLLSVLSVFQVCVKVVFRFGTPASALGPYLALRLSSNLAELLIVAILVLGDFCLCIYSSIFISSQQHLLSTDCPGIVLGELSSPSVFLALICLKVREFIRNTI